MKVFDYLTFGFFVFLTFVLPTVGYSQNHSWEAATSLFTPRDQFTGGVINGNIYVFGGNGLPDGRNLKSTEVFDPETQIWTYLADNENNNGQGVEELSGAVVDGKLYVFGAYGGGDPYGVFNFVEQYDPITDTWTSKAQKPTTVSAAPAVIYDGEIYLFGGYSNDNGVDINYKVVEAYNPSTNAWRFVTTMPRTISNMAVAVVGTKVYLIGGYDHETNSVISDVIAYDFDADEWITSGLGSLQTPRGFMYSSSAPIMGGKIFLVGGWTVTSGSWTNITEGDVAPTDNVLIYDPLTHIFTSGPSLPQPTDDHLTVLLNDTIYVIGGKPVYEEYATTRAVWKLGVSDTGNMITSDLWIKAVINTVEKGPIDAVWKKGGEDVTSRGDRVIWGHFYASPSDVTWGSQNNPDLFVKIWFDVSGRVDVNYFHVSVPEIEVYSDYPYDGSPDEQGTTTMDRRYIRQYYENGQSNSDENYEDGNPPAGYWPTGNPSGYSTINDLRIGNIINTVEKGPINAVWRLGGQDTTLRGDQVVWGHFYASPSDVTWGSSNNPDLFMKIWFDVSGRVDVNFFHVSVPDIEGYSDLPSEGAYDQKGTTIMDNRYIRHEYWR